MIPDGDRGARLAWCWHLGNLGAFSHFLCPEAKTKELFVMLLSLFCWCAGRGRERGNAVFQHKVS